MFASKVGYGLREMVTLKDLQQVAATTFLSTMITLQELAKEHFEAFFDLVEICKDQSYPLKSCHETLKKYGMLNNDGKVITEAVKAIILNATEGEGFDLRLIDPRLVSKS